MRSVGAVQPKSPSSRNWAIAFKVMGAGPVEGTVKELVPAFALETGHKVEGVFNTVGFVQERLKAGEKPDILILSAPVMEAMEKDGSLVAGFRRRRCAHGIFRACGVCRSKARPCG
jgi:hypothetical protein